MKSPRNWSNQQAAANPAMTPQLQCRDQRRGLAEPGRWAASQAMRRVTTPSIGLFAGCLLLVGCAHTVRVEFQAVDTRTGRPLAGVSTAWSEDVDDLLLGSHHFGPTNLPPSAVGGAIIVEGVHKTRVSRFTFVRSGYPAAYVLYSGGAFTRADSAGFGPNGQFTVLFDPLRSVQPTNGVVVIDMTSR